MIVAALSLSLMLLESPYRPLPPGDLALAKPGASKSRCKEMRMSATGKAGRANLPFAMGRRFATLDEYLAHLECRARPMDLPWYRQIRPGVYELQTGNLRKVGEPGKPRKQVFTRRELELKFGFAS
jgi:hypothetical protein